MKRKLFCAFLALLLLLPLSGLGESVGSEIVFGMISSKTYTIDPLLPQERELVSIYGVVYESLITIDDDGLPQPYLAESWSYSNGGKTWTFQIRDDVVFSDGTPLTARDIAASGNFILQNAKDENASDKGFYRNMTYLVDSFSATGDYTLTVKAARPYYGLLFAMTFPVIKESEIGMENPVGTGPYVISSFEPGNYLLLDASPTWWQTQPQVQNITIMFYPNNKSMISAYEYGQVDGVFTRSVAAAQYKSGKTALSIKYNTRQLEVLMLNHRSRAYPLDSVNVRKAVRYAINVDTIVSQVYSGHVSECDTPVPTDSFLYLDQESTFVYNPDKARELLAAEGWSDIDNDNVLEKVPEGETNAKNLRLSLYVYEDPDNDIRFQTADLIADMLGEVGFDIHVETVSYERGLEILQNGNYDMFLCAFQMDVVPDYGFFLHKSNNQNYGRYLSSEMSSLIDTLRKQPEQSDFIQTTYSIQQLFAEDVPFICLFYRSGAVLTRKMYTTVRTLREFELLRGIESFGR